MRIFIDIGHPAHVHYCRNLYKEMTQKGHLFFISARNREFIFQLLDYYEIPYTSRGKGKNSRFGKLIYMLWADLRLLFLSIRFKPDLYISYGSPYAAQASWILRKPHLNIIDTEHAKLNSVYTNPFSKWILTPDCFTQDLGKKHIKFKSYNELNYLHPDYYSPDSSVRDELDLQQNEKFILIRFISWQANHDRGYSGLNYEEKSSLVHTLLAHARVFISSEGVLPSELERYRLRTRADQIYDVISEASLFITEGATMASEAVVLATPVIYLNELSAGTLKEQEKYGLINGKKIGFNLLEKAVALLNGRDIRSGLKTKKARLLRNKINPTKFLTWVIENYPDSVNKMYEEPDAGNKY